MSLDSMASPAQVAERTAEFAKLVETDEDRRALQKHLEDLLHGDAFRGSQRSAHFLRYIVDHAMKGHCDELKERLIGVELFGRAPTYDTGEDAIVRVAASDVRRRLAQHYGVFGTASAFRIRLPLGSYIPEIVRDTPVEHEVSSVLDEPGQNFSEPPRLTFVDPLKMEGGEVSSARIKTVLWSSVTVLCALCLGIVFTFIVLRSKAAQIDNVWPLLFDPQLNVAVITSDPDLVETQILTGQPVSLSDYANGRYIPHPEQVSPQLINFVATGLHGDKSASIDTGLTVKISRFFDIKAPDRLSTHAARNIRLADLLVDGNFVLLGSPRSNPWSQFYSDHLDFRYEYDSSTHQEVIRNVHPHSGELKSYLPTAMGYATGQSFATASYLKNPDHRGHVLLVAGANAEGTLAVGDFLTKEPLFRAALQQCGLLSGDAVPNFQFLVRLSTMAGEPSHSNVIACHILAQ